MKAGDVYNLTDSPGEDCYFWILKIIGVSSHSINGRLFEAVGGYENEDGEIELGQTAEMVADLHVKWDGCTNISWNDELALHLCGGFHWQQFCFVLQAALARLFSGIAKGNAREADIDRVSTVAREKWKLEAIKLKEPL